MAKFCARCSRHAHESAVFCETCGSELTEDLASVSDASGASAGDSESTPQSHLLPPNDAQPTPQSQACPRCYGKVDGRALVCPHCQFQIANYAENWRGRAITRMRKVRGAEPAIFANAQVKAAARERADNTYSDTFCPACKRPDPIARIVDWPSGEVGTLVCRHCGKPSLRVSDHLLWVPFPTARLSENIWEFFAADPKVLTPANNVARAPNGASPPAPTTAPRSAKPRMEVIGKPKVKLVVAITIVVSLLFVGFVTLILYVDAKSAEQTRIAQQSAAVDAQQKAAVSEQRFNAMSSKEHIAEATKLLVVDAPEGDVQTAESHLAAAQKDAQKQVAAIRAKFKSAQAAADDKRKKTAAAEQKKQEDEDRQTRETVRRALAASTQDGMLRQGYDMKISAVGPEHRILRIEWVLMNRPAIYQMIHAPSFWDSLREDGFTKVIATDGYDQTWTWKLDAY